MRPFLHSPTTLTCEGEACSRCRITIDMCQCDPHRHFNYRSVSERISGQGWVPETEMREAA